MMHSTMTGTNIAKLTASVLGGPYKRAASKDAATERFLSVAHDRGLPNAKTMLCRPFNEAAATIGAWKSKTSSKSNGNVKPNETAAPSPADPLAAAVAEAVDTYLKAEKHGETLIEQIAAAAFEAGVAAKTRKPRANREGGSTKREIAAGLLCRAEGCTTRDILDATGWPAVSVPAIAKASGLKLRQERDGGRTRYFGEPL